ncbi:MULTISPECIES: hypothetical protein [Clostridium]|uniref:hypothetical protein n=1 Tax=Clostridium TaxID=1485 RepID=UPI0029436163|nr:MULTISPECIES: hypothetical protein [unclassified Clostridium]
MNRKIIYVDFIFKRKKITSKTLLFIYNMKINIKIFFNNIFVIKPRKKKKTSNNITHYPFRKVL